MANAKYTQIMTLVSTETADKYQELFNFFSQEHNLTLTIGEMDDILNEVVRHKNRMLVQQFETDRITKKCAELIVEKQLATLQLLQRDLKLGYMRAMRIFEHLEYMRIIAPLDNKKERNVIVSNEDRLKVIIKSFGIE